MIGFVIIAGIVAVVIVGMALVERWFRDRFGRRP